MASYDLDIMAAVLRDLQAHESELENLWRVFNSCWVSASEELARAEELARQASSEAMYAQVHVLRIRERRQRAILDEFERRMHELRSRTGRYPARY